MATKCESRGKYPGVKAHLDPEECEWLLACVDSPFDPEDAMQVFCRDLGKKIRKLMKSEPGLLQPRTHAQIEAELIEEGKKSAKKLAKAGAGLAWNDKADPTAHLVVFPSGKVQLHHRSVFGEWDSWGVFLSEAAIPIARVKIHPLVKEAS